MKIFKLKLFHKWANKEGLTDESLKKAVKEMEQGLIDADLGGHVYKKRIGIQGQGKRGGGENIDSIQSRGKRFFYVWLC